MIGCRDGKGEREKEKKIYLNSSEHQIYSVKVGEQDTVGTFDIDVYRNPKQATILFWWFRKLNEAVTVLY